MIWIYRNDLAAANKNGTKYLQRQFGERVRTNYYNLVLDDSFFYDINYIVFKHPGEYLASAINTFIVDNESNNKKISNKEYTEMLVKGEDNHWLLDYYNIIHMFILKKPSTLLIDVNDLSNFISVVLKEKPVEYESTDKTKVHVIYDYENKKKDKWYKKTIDFYDKVDVFEFLDSSDKFCSEIIKNILARQLNIYYHTIRNFNFYKKTNRQI